MTYSIITSNTLIFSYSNPIIFTTKMNINFAIFKNICIFANKKNTTGVKYMTMNQLFVVL